MTECNKTTEWQGETVTCVRVEGHEGSHVAERGQFWTVEPEPETPAEPVECEVCVHKPHERGGVCGASLTDSMGTPVEDCQCNGSYIPKKRPDESEDEGVTSESEFSITVTVRGTVEASFEQAQTLVENGYGHEREWDDYEGEFLLSPREWIDEAVRIYIEREGYDLVSGDITFEVPMEYGNSGVSYGFEDVEVEEA